MNQYRRIKEYHRQLSQSVLLAGMIQTEEWGKKREYAYTDEDILGLTIDNVLAPALNGFVVWVLHQALEKHIERLYFLARDGYFMYRTAREYVRAYSLPIECRYLYCSRYSVRIPAYYLDEEKALSYITLGGLDVTVKKIYQRAGMKEEQREILYKEAVLPYDKNRQILRREFGQIRDKLRKHELFMKFMRENSRRALPAYEQYLSQEGLMDKVKLALVDSGWVGSMQKELEQSLQRLGRRDSLTGFYWGLYEIPAGMDRRFYHTYFFSPEGETREKTVFNNCLFETIFTAPHGMTLGYQKYGEKIEPVLSVMQAERAEKICVMEKRFAAWQKRFFKQYPGKSFDELAKSYGQRQTFKAATKNLVLFMHHPTKEEAQVFGEMEFTDDVLEVKGNKIATGISMRQSAWYEGSTTICSKYPEFNIALCTAYKFLLYRRKKWRYMRREYIT